MKLRRFLSAMAMVVVLTPNGFEPKSLSVSAGSTVTFKTTLGRYFWPASNDHPAHTLYPEFDPKSPIEPDKSWSFVFEKEGVWKFHDHISPNFTGEVIVSGQTQEKKSDFISKIMDLFAYMKTFIAHNVLPLNYDVCRDPSINRDSRIECWQKLVVSIVQRTGLRGALAFVNSEKDRNTAFAADCHVYVHRIGEEYYWKFMKDKKVEVSDLFDLCDQGFFHGFMQEFTSHRTSITEARRYCDLLMTRVKNDEKTMMLKQQCYHGIGHGSTFLYAGYYWGDNERIIKEALVGCKSIFPEDPRFCISGAFGGMAAMYWGLHGFKLDLDHADPWALCANQTNREYTDCVDQMVPVIFGELGFDLLKTGRIVEQISDENTAIIAMEHAGSMPSYTIVPKTNDYSDIVTTCRMFRSPLNEHCLRGFSAAVFKIGSLTQGSSRAKAFCQTELLTAGESKICFEAVVRQIEMKYSQKEADTFVRENLK